MFAQRVVSGRSCATSRRAPAMPTRSDPCSRSRVIASAKPAGGHKGYKHLLLTILDANTYLSDGSKQAVATAAQMAVFSSGKVTVLVVDEQGTKAQNPSARIENINWHFNNSNGFKDYTILEKDISTPASVLIGDVADEIQADIVLLSTEAIHAKHVDANQLAEFVSIPLLLLP